MREKIEKLSELLVEISVLAIVFLVPLFFSWSFWSFEAFEINKIVLFRCLLILGCLFYFLKVLLKGSLDIPRKKYLFIFLFFLLISFFASSFLSGSQDLSLWGKYGREQGLYSLISYVIFLLLLAFYLRDLKQVKRILLAIMLSSLAVCLYGGAQFLGLDYINWQEPATKTGRIFSTLGQPNFLGHFLIMTIPLIMYFLLFVARKKWIKLLSFILFLLNIFCLISTYSRAAWIGFALSFFIFLIGVLFLKNKKISAILTFLIVSLALILTLFLSYSGQIRTPDKDDALWVRRILGSFEIDSGSVNLRLAYWKAGLNEIKSMPLPRLFFGYGPDSLGDVYLKNYDTSWAIYESLPPDRSHNFLLDIIISFGLFGSLVWVFFVIYVAKRVQLFFKRKKDETERFFVFAILISFFAYFCNNLFSFSATTHLVYFYLLLAILLFLMDRDRPCKKIFLNWPFFSKILVFLLLVFLSVVLIFYYNICFVLADNHYLESQKTAKADCLSSWENNFQSVNLNPYSIYYKDRLLARSIGCLENMGSGPAKKEFQERVKLLVDWLSEEKGDFNFSLSRAALKSILGGEHRKAARGEFLELENKYPLISPAYRYHAYLEILEGRFQEAIDVLEQGFFGLTPLENFQEDNKHKQSMIHETARFYELFAWSYEALGDLRMAASYYEKMVSISPYHLPAYDKLFEIFKGLGADEEAQYYRDKKKEYEPFAKQYYE